MPSKFYHCKYCHQIKQTETALNRHIAHSVPCFQSWQNELVRLTSSTIGVEGNINRRAGTMDDSLLPDSLGNDSNLDMDVVIFDKTIPDHKNAVPSKRTEASDDAGSQSRYRKAYPGGYAAKILGEGKTNFQQWEEDESLHGKNEWAPFHSQKEWDLVQWLIKNVGQKTIDEYLKLPIASIGTHIHS
jgi:hypothetical protein